MLFTLLNSAAGSRRARQRVKRLILCFSLYLCWVDASMWRQCDNGKLWLEKDLPHWAVYHCAGTSWSESIQNLPSIETKQPIQKFLKPSLNPLYTCALCPQPAVSVCMQTPITYNHTIPSSGAHRPVQAETGEYLYCPPQRWLHNLQLGATVFLYHPCASVLGQVRLSVLAHLCLSHYIVTPHRELSMNRPFAMVSLGRVLELSHVTESEACDWLVENAVNGLESRKQRRRKYNLYLTQPASVSTVTDTGGRREKSPAGVEQKQALRRCCMEALSWPEEEEAETNRNRRKKRRRRAEFSQGEGRTKPEDVTHTGSDNYEALSPLLPNNLGPKEEQRHRTVRSPMRNEGEAVTQSEGISAKKEPEKTLQRDSLPLGVAEGRGPSGVVQSKRDTSTELKHGGDNSSNSELHRRLGPRPPKLHTQDRRGQRYENKTVHQDTPECCECVVTGAPPEDAVLRVKQPTLRTDEAVWAAAALGFLLVLLALSVLHTRLYQHWRTAPSLYWHHPRHDDDSVADVVRRRLKMLGRKKRRAPQGRRQEFMLLPSSSTEEELE